MKIRLFSDPHMGLNRTSHTTPASRAKLRDKLSESVRNITSDSQMHGTACLGDLFDTYNVDNLTMLEGLSAYNKCFTTLHGNHDLANRMDVISSLELISLIGGAPIDRYEGNDPRASTFSMGVPFWWVDHKFNQALFEEALDDAMIRATNGSVLLLHCNYNSSFAVDESSLNLTREKAEHLLTKFSYIFIGHEHITRQDFGGRLVLTGNTHPTGFSDISNKYIWDLEIENGQVVRVVPHLFWKEDLRYVRLHWSDLSELSHLSDLVEFVEVVGEANPQHMPLISKQIADLWKMSDNLLMVRNKVTAIGDVKQAELTEATRCQSIPERISTDLADTDIGGIWSQYLERL